MNKSGDSASLPRYKVFFFFPFAFLPSSFSFSLPPFFFSLIFPLLIPCSFLSQILSFFFFFSFPFSFFKNFVIFTVGLRKLPLLLTVWTFSSQIRYLFNAYLVTCSLVNYIDESCECRRVIHYWDNLTWSCFKICLTKIIF